MARPVEHKILQHQEFTETSSLGSLHRKKNAVRFSQMRRTLNIVKETADLFLAEIGLMTGSPHAFLSTVSF